MPKPGRLATESSVAPSLTDEHQAGPPIPVALVSDPVANYYERKTESILSRYGPGPRVHFHTGFRDDPPTQATAAQLRSQIRDSQERMLRVSADAWNFRGIDFRQVLDVGCGLGGSAIFWAEEFGADVTAITMAHS